MLPSSAELRERSRIAHRTARNAVDVATKRRLAAAAMVLAEVANAVERGDDATVERLQVKLADALAGVPTETQIDPARPADGDAVLAARMKKWRMRAAELRAVADQFLVPSAQAGLRSAATYYERLADQA